MPASFSTGPLDWDFLCAQADEQAVLQLVHRRAASRYADLVPPRVLTRMAEECRWLTQLSQALTRALVDLLPVFSAQSIGVLPYKGPTLGLQAYGDPALRTFADLDILVRPADLDAARAVLLSGSFFPFLPHHSGSARAPGAPRKPRELRARRRRGGRAALAHRWSGLGLRLGPR